MEVILGIFVLILPILLIVLFVKVAGLKANMKRLNNDLANMWATMNARMDQMSQKDNTVPDGYQQNRQQQPAQYWPPPMQHVQPPPPYAQPPQMQQVQPPPVQHVQPPPVQHVQPPPVQYVQPPQMQQVQPPPPPYAQPPQMQQVQPSPPPYAQPSPMQQVQPPPPEYTRKFNEGWIGRIVFGIAASTLVFIGLLFLGVWAWNKMGNELKVLLMFVGSGLITGLGIVLGLKKRNVFTNILTGCGCGAAFISIMVTHLYYGMISDIPAYCILIGWLVAVLFITRLQQSVYLSIVAHLGMAISICFACYHMVDGNPGFLLAYQFVSVAVIIAGNLLCYRQTYRFGLLLSLGLTIIVCGFMHATSGWIHISSISRVMSHAGLMTWNTAFTLGAQFLCASCLSCLLSVSAARVKDEAVMALLHVFNKLMWIVMLYIALYPIITDLFAQASYRFWLNGVPSPLLFSILICFAVAALHMGVTMLMRRKFNFHPLLESISIGLMSGVWLVLLLALRFNQTQSDFPALSYMFIPGLLLLGAGRINRNSVYNWAASAFFAVDLLSALTIRYVGLPLGGVIALAAGYIVLTLGLILCMRKKLGFGQLWERVAVYFTGGVWLILLMILWRGGYIIKSPSLAFFFIPGLLLLGAGRISRNSAYKYAANVFFIADLIQMLTTGYRELMQATTIVASLGYMLLYLVVLWGQWPPVTREKKNASMPARLGAYIIVLTSLIEILLASDIGHKEVITLITLTALGIALFLLRYDEHITRSEPLHWMMRVIEYLLYIISAFTIAFAKKPTTDVIALFWVLAVLTVAIGFMRVRDVLKAPYAAEHIPMCLMSTGIILAIIRGFAPAWFEAVYVLSLASMVSALLCVVIGFISRVKALRLYGLVLTLACVLKLITYDVRDLETPLRIIALISGGIICFVISALYSYSEERLKKG